MDDHQWGDRTISAFDHREGSGWTERTVYRLTRICTRCGVSRSAVEHFGWAKCTGGDDGE